MFMVTGKPFDKYLLNLYDQILMQILTDAALLKRQKLEIEDLRKKLQVMIALCCLQRMIIYRLTKLKLYLGISI